MKKILFFILLLVITGVVKAQITGTYQIKGADTVKIWKTGGSVNPNATELILQNSSDTVPGFLWNNGVGVTKFKRPLTKINSTTYLVGIDTLYIGVEGGGSPGGSNTNIQINYNGSFVGVGSFLYDTTRKVLVSSGFLNNISTASNGLIIGQSNVSNGQYGAIVGLNNTAGNYGYVLGANSTASGYSISTGNGNIGTNALSATFGNNLINTYQNSLVIGAFNDTTSWPNAAIASNTSLYPVFSIGNGANNSLRSNAFTILHNGQIIIKLFNNSTLDSVLAVDMNGNVIQKKVTGGSGGGGTLDSVGLIMPTGFTVSGSPVIGTGGHLTVTSSLSGVVHASGGVFTGSQVVDADVNNVSWSKITSTPTTVTGYGITNAVRTDLTYASPSWLTAVNWAIITGTPTSLAGYGITDPVVLTSGSYANPGWITQLAWSKIISTPTTIAGYGITDNLVNSVNGQHGITIVKNADSIKSLPVDTSVRRNAYVLTFDSTNHKWYLSPNGSGTGPTTFAGLTDVNITSPANNQIPVYNSGTSKWTNTSVTTSIITEGSNLYWTNARFLTAFKTETTDSLPEGTSNLYFTTSRARSSVSPSPPIVYSSTTGVISIQNAKADGSTLGAAAFTASDFNDNGSGLISIDYANGQVATNSVNGFLSAADHTTFSAARTLTYAQNAVNNTLAINGGNSQTFLTGTPSLAGLLDTARAKFIDSLKNGLKTFTVYAGNLMTASGGDSLNTGGTALNNTTFAMGAFTFSITGLPNKTTPLSTDSLLIETLAGQFYKLPITSSVTSVSGTANRITSTGGITPVIDISASYVGQNSITTLGTIVTGVWNGTAIANANLANSSVTINGATVSLGASITTNWVGTDSVQSVTSGGSVTQTTGYNIMQINPASPISITITTATAFHTNNDLWITFGGTISSGNPVATVTMVAGAGLTFVESANPNGITYNAGEHLHFHKIGSLLYRWDN